ncbi:MAG: P-loop NTPase [Candidatus Helarchaeota archaeon]
MSREVTVLSGKGGVGKTTLTASLAALFENDGEKIIAVDTDVDAPNLLLILGGKEKEKKSIEASAKAFFDLTNCRHCGACEKVCKFGAISWDQENDLPIFSRLHCEGCGACSLVCPEKCIEIKPVKSGTVIHVESKLGFPVITGDIEIGDASSGKIVSEAKTLARELSKKGKIDTLLVDGPPGVGCPVIASASGSSYIILVSEPTPAAKHDLERALDIASFFCNRIGLVINKADINQEFTNQLIEYAKIENLDLLGTIPVDDSIPKAIINGKPVVVDDPKSPASIAIGEIYKNLKKLLKQ